MPAFLKYSMICIGAIVTFLLIQSIDNKEEVVSTTQSRREYMDISREKHKDTSVDMREYLCTDGKDNDKDGMIDCADRDCKQDKACKPGDIDGDGIPNEIDPDIDGDGIPNEIDPDIDGDGIPNEIDPDIDGDGIPNEIDPDIDGDGIPNEIDPDIDGDGIPNEIDPDIDGDGIPNRIDLDRDGDAQKEYLCTDGKDNDNDGKRDCDDTDCFGDAACISCGVPCKLGQQSCHRDGVAFHGICEPRGSCISLDPVPPGKKDPCTERDFEGECLLQFKGGEECRWQEISPICICRGD